MRAERNQTTLAAPCTVSGRGYWTGKSNALTFVPAPADTGICFVRTDLVGAPRVTASTANRSSLSLRTCLQSGRARVDMVEHVLAAFHGLAIDNAFVRCTAAEMPAMDGSSQAFTLALQQAGRTELPPPRASLAIEQTVRVGNQQQWIVAEPLHANSLDTSTNFGGLHLEYQLDYGPSSPLAKSSYRIALTTENFIEQVAAARTFISMEDARRLQAQGLATHVTERDLLVFDNVGPVNNRLRFEDECARHKLLDLIGDLALAEINLVGRITAHRSGHQLNGEMAEALRQMYCTGSTIACEQSPANDERRSQAA